MNGIEKSIVILKITNEFAKIGQSLSTIASLINELNSISDVEKERPIELVDRSPS